jgi:CRISPR/Cas system-associated endonuclease Cas1
MMLCLRTINTTGTEKSLRSKNGFPRYLQRTALVLATEVLAAVRCDFLSVAETADLTQIHSFLQVADCQNQPRSSYLQIRESSKLKRATTVADLRVAEGRVAKRYWEAFTKVLPEHLDFQGRMTASHQNNASDSVNLALNYGYGFLEGEVREAINSAGLEPSDGFLYDSGDYQTKRSLVYDSHEPFHWISDSFVIEAFESEALKLSDFYFIGDDYRYWFEPEARQRLIGLIRERFNSGAIHRGRVLKWDTIIQEKTNELARYLNGRSQILDFSDPSPVLEKTDNRAVREAILTLTQGYARKLGIGKSTLHNLKKRARNMKTLRVYAPVLERFPK